MEFNTLNTTIAILTALLIFDLTLIVLVMLVNPRERTMVAIRAIESLTSIMKVFSFRLDKGQKAKKITKPDKPKPDE